MGADYIPLEEAVRKSGLHTDTLKRLLRAGVIEGYKAVYQGRRRWIVSVASLGRYTDPFHGFLLELPGPRLWLRKLDEREDNED